MKIPISKLAAAFCVSFVLLLAACTAPAEQNTPDDTQSQTQETPETENQNNQQPQGGTKNEDVERKKATIEELFTNTKKLNTSKWTFIDNKFYNIKFPHNWYHINDKWMEQSDNTLRFDTISPIKPPFPDSFYGIIGPSDGFIMDIKTSSKNSQNQMKLHKGQQFLFEKEIEINGEKNKLVISINKNYPIYAEILIKEKDFYYYLETELFNLDPTDEQNDLNLLVNILKTFKTNPQNSQGETNDEDVEKTDQNTTIENWNKIETADTSQWEDYTNTEYKFQIKRPKGWESNLRDDPESIFSIIFTPPLPANFNQDKEEITNVQLRSQLYINIYSNPERLSIKDWIKTKSNIYTSTKGEIQINDKLYTVVNVGGMVDITGFLITKDAHIYEIDFHSYPPITTNQKYNESIIKEFKAVLNTFNLL